MKRGRSINIVGFDSTTNERCNEHDARATDHVVELFAWQDTVKQQPESYTCWALSNVDHVAHAATHGDGSYERDGGDRS